MTSKKGAAKKVKKSAMKKSKRLSPMKELQGRHMRMTQELDGLATTVARQGQLLGEVHLALQQAKLMPYAPAVQPLTKVKLETQVKLDGGSTQPSFGHRGTINYYDVIARKNGETVGYLSNAGTWTLDPKQIETWKMFEDAQAALSKVRTPEGTKAEIRGHTSY